MVRGKSFFARRNFYRNVLLWWLLSGGIFLIEVSKPDAQSCDPGVIPIGTAYLIHHSSSCGSPFLPVLLVHGIQPFSCGKGGGSGTWGQAIDLLDAAGVDVWEFQYESGDFIDDSAQLLSQAVTTLLAQAAMPRVRVIAD